MKNKENISKIFLLPGVKIKDSLRRKFNDAGFVNSYLTCDKLTYPFNVIYLVFKPAELNVEFCTFIEELQENTNFVEVIDLANGKVLVVYRIPKEFNRDYQLFIDGKYSKLSKEFKKCFAMEKNKVDEKGNPIRENGHFVTEPTNYYHIFYKTEFMKEHLKEKLGVDDEVIEGLEFYSKQDPQEETLIEEPVWL